MFSNNVQDNMLDFVINNIQFVGNKLVKNRLIVNKKMLLDNFDYFSKSAKYSNSNEATLDLDLNFKSFKICYNFVQKEQIECETNQIRIRKFIGVLEIFDVLICSKRVVDSFVSNLVVLLENSRTEQISYFIKTLETNRKINHSLKENLHYRLAYLCNPEFYYTNDENKEENTIIVIIVPKKKWQYVIPEPIDQIHLKIKNFDCTNWGQIYSYSHEKREFLEFRTIELEHPYLYNFYIPFRISRLTAAREHSGLHFYNHGFRVINGIRYCTIREPDFIVKKVGLNHKEGEGGEVEFTITNSTGISKSLLTNNRDCGTKFITTNSWLETSCNIFSENDLHVLVIKSPSLEK